MPGRWDPCPGKVKAGTVLLSATGGCSSLDPAAGQRVTRGLAPRTLPTGNWPTDKLETIARVLESADSIGSNPMVRKGVRVRTPPRALSCVRSPRRAPRGDLRVLRAGRPGATGPEDDVGGRCLDVAVAEATAHAQHGEPGCHRLEIGFHVEPRRVGWTTDAERVPMVPDDEQVAPWRHGTGGGGEECGPIGGLGVHEAHEDQVELAPWRAVLIGEGDDVRANRLDPSADLAGVGGLSEPPERHA